MQPLLGNGQDRGLTQKVQMLKLWVRVLKFFSRLLSLICRFALPSRTYAIRADRDSGVVIGLSALSFHIFLATRDLPPTNGAQPWASRTVMWPQVMTLVIACLSFAAALAVMAGYLRGGHRRAESLSRWATLMTVIGFVGWIVLWAAAGASLQRARDQSRGRDIWAWACDKEAAHHQLFSDRINYDLVCKAQDWNFVCAWIHVATIAVGALAWAAAAWRLGVRAALAK